MKLKDANKYVGRDIYKLGRKEQLVKGTVVHYSSMTATFVAVYTDGSSGGIAVDEIEDVVPIASLPGIRRSKTNRTNGVNVPEPGARLMPRTVTNSLFRSTGIDYASAGKAVPTTGSNPPSDKKKREGKHLAPPVYGNGKSGLASLVKHSKTKTQKKSRHTPSKSRCDSHVRELLLGTPGVNYRMSRDKATKALHKTPKQPPEKIRMPVEVDLTGDGTSEEEEVTRPDSHTHVRFGMTSTMHFKKGESVEAFRRKIRKRGGESRAKLPKQNPELCQSAMESSSMT